MRSKKKSGKLAKRGAPKVTTAHNPKAQTPNYRAGFRVSAEVLDFDSLPGPEHRTLSYAEGEPATLSAEESRACWIRTFNMEMRQPMYAKPERITICVNGQAAREKGEVQGVSLIEFTTEDVALLLNEIRGNLHTLDTLAKWHPDPAVWQRACRVMADIAFLVLRNRPETSALQKPFQQLWLQEQSNYCARWNELAKPGERTPESLRDDPVRRVLYNAAMTVMGYFGQHIVDIAKFITDPSSLHHLVKRQALCFERPVKTLDNGLRMDRFSLLVEQFLIEIPGFKEGGPYGSNHFHQLRRLPALYVDRFEKTVVRPYLTEGGKNSVWKREVMPVLAKCGARTSPSSHKGTIRHILERDFVLHAQWSHTT